MKIKILGVLILMTLLIGCATYYTTPQRLLSQLNDTKSNGQFSGITNLNCVDKDGKDYVLVVTGNTQIRITKKDDMRQTFYFYTGYLQDSIITGSKSTFFKIPIKPVL